MRRVKNQMMTPYGNLILLFLFLLVCAGSTNSEPNKNACPAHLQKLGCKCSHVTLIDTGAHRIPESENGFTVDCRGLNLDEIPNNIPASTTHLYLSHNDISSIESQDLVNLKSLLELDMGSNYLKHIQEGSFKDLASLEKLILQDNYLDFNDARALEDVFTDVQQLKALDIRNNIPLNYSSGYPTWLWKHISDLHSLYIDGIRSRINNEFLKLRNLNTLSFDGSDCKVYSIHDDYFSGLRNSPLTKLDMTGCQLSYFDGMAFKHITNLTWLSVAKNPLQGALIKMATGLNMTSIEYLDLNETQIGLKDRVVDLFKGPLCNISSLKYLSVANNTIYTFGRVMKDCFQSLEVFSFANNCLFEHTDDLLDIFDLQNLRFLNMSYQYTYEYDHSNSRKRRSYRRRYARQLDIGDTHICESGEACPLSLPPKLEVIDVSNGGQYFHIIPEIELQSYTTMKNLISSNTGITSVSGPLYCHYPEMVWESLDLSRNRIDYFHPEFFKNCDWTKMRNVSLYGNKLAYLLHNQGGKPFFQYLKGLKDINLGDNSLENGDLHLNVFRGNPNLTHLRLANNQLTDLQPDVSKLRSLQYLDLSNNSVEYLSLSLISNLDTILRYTDVTINLEGNRLQCSCDTEPSIKWMYLHASIFVHLDKYQCTFPDGTMSTFRRFKYLLQRLNGDCSSWKWLTIPFSVSLVLMIFTATLALLYRWRYALDVIWYRRRSSSDEDSSESGEFIYDCFVGFNRANCSWVEEELLPNIEPPGRGMRTLRPEELVPVTQDMDHFRLAVHHRDFKIGMHITENIFDAVEQSRTTLMVISNTALRGPWWHYELRMAIENAVLRRNNSLLFVFLEPVEGRLVSPQLRRILNMYTCERWWPHDPQRQSNLWQKLRRAIKYPTPN